MERTAAATLVLVMAVIGCSEARDAAPLRTQANEAPRVDAATEPPFEEDPGEQPACPPAPKGWRSMASAPMVDGAPLRIFQILAGEPVWSGREMFLYAADSMSNAFTPIAYDPLLDTWRVLPPPPRRFLRPAWTSLWTGRQWIAGGRFVLPSGRTILALAAYDPATDKWTDLPDNPLGFVRVFYSAATDELVALDGARVATYGFASGTWSLGPASPISSAGEMAWDGRRVVVAYGTDATLVYTPLTGTWATAAKPPYDFFPQFGFDAFEDRSVVFFGERSPTLDNASLMRGTVFSGEAFRIIGSPPSAVLSDGDVRAAWAAWRGPRSVYVFGGFLERGDDPLVNDGARYDLDSETWTRLPDGGPSPRYFAMALHTGCDSLVFGGLANGVYLQDGGRLRE